MGDKTRGLYGKFGIERTDGRHNQGEKHEGCEYFVLDLNHDFFAYAALIAYRDACQEAYPLLAADLTERIDNPLLPEINLGGEYSRSLGKEG